MWMPEMDTFDLKTALDVPITPYQTSMISLSIL